MKKPRRGWDDIEIVIPIASRIAAAVAGQWYEMGGWRSVTGADPDTRASYRTAQMDIAQFADGLARDVIFRARFEKDEIDHARRSAAAKRGWAKRR